LQAILDRGANVFATLLETNGDWVLALARVVLGVVFFAHGAQKLLGWFGGHGLNATIGMFRDQLGIPTPLAYLAIAAEFFGGLGLIVGLLARVAALGVAVTMVVAMVKVHLQHGFFLNWFGDKQGHGFEYHLLAIALAVLLIVHGAGAGSLDRVLYRYLTSPDKVALEFNLVIPFLFRLKPTLFK
jgi:putative oxidoreductase